MKVFWFFFSKKNTSLLSLAAHKSSRYLGSMRRILRRLRRTLGVLLLLVLLLLAGAAALVWRTLPGGNASAAIPGLSAPVDITIDQDGMPRIHAATEADAASAVGWLHARERMFQMELMRRAAGGTLAELVGRLALPNDRTMRVLGVRAHAEADFVDLPPETRAVLEAYARGVNAYIATRGRFVAPEFLPFGAPAPWTPVDSLLWAKTMGLYLSGNWRTELGRAALAQRLPPDAVNGLFPSSSSGPGHPEAALQNMAAKLAAAIPRFPAPFTQPQTASNEWAVDGTHSATGAPLLAGDPHLGFSMPGIWYLARIELPGRVLAGATAPGVPFLVLGHNGHIAWTFTTTGADVQDLFVETPSGTDSYLTPDGPKPFTTRQERIRIRGEADEVLTVRETRHGPIISDIINPSGPLLAISMGNLAPGDTAAAGLQALNAAQDVAAAGEAAARITDPVQNLLVADGKTIGLFVTGRVPIRRAGNGSAPVPGADGAHDWIGWAQGDQLPHIVAPPRAAGSSTRQRARRPTRFPGLHGPGLVWRLARPAHPRAAGRQRQADAGKLRRHAAGRGEPLCAPDPAGAAARAAGRRPCPRRPGPAARLGRRDGGRQAPAAHLQCLDGPLPRGPAGEGRLDVPDGTAGAAAPTLSPTCWGRRAPNIGATAIARRCCNRAVRRRRAPRPWRPLR